MGQTRIPSVLPRTDEHAAAPASPVSATAHTGTDVIAYERPGDPQNGQTMQLMTWEDGNDVYLSWDFFDNTLGLNVVNTRVVPNAQGSTSFSTTPNSVPGQTPDPDVVLAYARDPATGRTELYANLVYISSDQTTYEVLRWDATNRTFASVSTTRLGNRDYKHSYPNIDANSQGLVAVTWQQTVTDQVTVTVVSTSNYFPSYTTVPPITVTFGRSVVAAGDILGNFRNCYNDQFSGTTGIYVINPPKGLLEQTLRPDVAISEGDESEAIVSSVFLRHYVDGAELFSIVNKLTVVQTQFDQCTAGGGEPGSPNGNVTALRVSDQHEWFFSEGNTLGTPRIAATGLGRNFSNRGTDVEVAIDRTVPQCGPTQYAILNYGKSRGVFRDTYTLVSPLGSTPDAPNFVRSVEPAISYSVVIPNRNINQVNATYLITWTGATPDEAQINYDKGVGDDVWAVTLAEGEHRGNQTSGPMAQPLGYNRVNLQGEGDQNISSVAGRFLQGNLIGKSSSMTEEELVKLLSQVPAASPNVHLFADRAKQQISYRRSGDFAGVGTPYRPAPATGLLQAYPNPAEGTVTVNLQLHPGEQVRSLTVVDVLGRPVATLALPISPTAAVQWKPASVLPAGVYTVRAVTSERTASTRVVRK